ncbi:MAG: hypothetical protein H0W87_00905 [Actinobacteria bacterium]|nr:hypothetical protein [Actinomycetota bacterium]
MRLRRLFLLGFLAAVVVAIWRLRSQKLGARVDLYRGDGSLTSFGEEDPEGALLLSLARDVRAS